MTRRRRLCTVLIALAVLGALPATALGAAPNQLSNGRVSPASGTTATGFTFSVEYTSDKGFPATSVVALVAGRAITLRLASGTDVAGTYSGASTLPAGTWPITFEAQASQGPGASLAGPTVVVSAPAPAPPPPPPAATPVPVTPPPPTSAPRAPAAPATTAAPSATPIPTAAGATSPPTPTPAPGATGTEAEDGAPSPGVRGSPVAGEPAGAVTERGAEGRASDVDLSFVAWMAGVAALGGLAAVVAAVRRRTPDDPEPVALHAVGPPSTTGPLDVEEGAMPRPVVLHQVEDPILSAMGLGRPAATGEPLETPLTRSVHWGPGERPAQSQKTRGRRR